MQSGYPDGEQYNDIPPIRDLTPEEQLAIPDLPFREYVGPSVHEPGPALPDEPFFVTPPREDRAGSSAVDE